MADTGAPWNLPYPLSTDLVRDGAQAIEDLAEDVADALTKAYTGIGTNVVQAVKTDTFATTSDTFTTVDGLSATITPTADTSKVLVICQLTHNLGNSEGYGAFKVVRGSTDIYRGNAAGSRVQAVWGGGTYNLPSEGLRFATISGSIVFLDSPGVNTATTYNVQIRRTTNGTARINRSDNDIDSASSTRGASSITLIEVAA
jgi:hypothetical protein